MDWFLLTATPTFPWAEQALQCGLLGFSGWPPSPALAPTLTACLERRRMRIPPVQDQAKPRAADLAYPIESAVAYIDSNLAEHLSLEVVSRQVYLSPSHFSRLFFQEVGVHFNDYVTFKRLEYAQRLMIHTNYSIEQIAFRVGYSSAAYFSNAFKRVMGESPRSYRAQQLYRQAP